MWVLMLVSITPTHCVSQCQLVYILDGSTTVRPHASHHAITNPAFLRIWSFHVFNELDQLAEFRALLPPGKKTKMIVLV